MKNRVQDGSITVFLSLLLVVLISLITTSLESAHLSAVRGRIGMSSEAAMYTLFSYFEKSLYEDYKLLFLNKRLNFNEILQSEMEFYGKNNDGIFNGNSHLRFGINSVAVSDVVCLMDDAGAAFQEEINQILAGDVVSMIKKTISGNIEQVSQSGIMTEYMNQIMQQGSELEIINEQISQVSEKSDAVSNNIGEFGKSVDSSLLFIEQYRKKIEDLEVEGRSGNENDEEYKKISRELKKLSDEKAQLQEELKCILNNLEKYEKSADKVNANLEEVSSGLLDENLNESYKSMLYDELRAILDMTSESGNWYQKVHEAKNTVQNDLKELQNIQIPLSEELTEDKILDGSVERELTETKNRINTCRGWEIPVTEVNVDNKYGFSGKSLLETVKTLITEGAFSIIVDNPNKLSKRVVDMADKPSQGKSDKAGTGGKNIFQGTVDDSKDTLTLNIYLADYIKCYTDKGNYDLEYVLGKSNSDNENLKTVVNQLVYLRQAMNLIHLLTDGVKKQQAQTTAAAMLAVTGNAALIQGMTMIILTAWAYAEAVSDVKALMNGDKIDFLKNSESWNLSLEQAADCRNWTRESKASEKSGMNYKEYLRILLFFHSRTKNMFRGLDMIQWNICQKDSGFRISQCVYSVEADFTLYVQPVFMSAGNLLSGKGAGYTYDHKEQKKYA